MKGLRIFAAALAIFSACSSGAEPFEDLRELRGALHRNGLECEDFKELSGSRLVAQRATCELSGSTITLYLFDSAVDLRRWKRVGSAFGHVAVGPNWAAAGREEAMMERVREKLDASGV